MGGSGSRPKRPSVERKRELERRERDLQRREEEIDRREKEMRGEMDEKGKRRVNEHYLRRKIEIVEERQEFSGSVVRQTRSVNHFSETVILTDGQNPVRRNSKDMIMPDMSEREDNPSNRPKELKGPSRKRK